MSKIDYDVRFVPYLPEINPSAKGALMNLDILLVMKHSPIHNYGGIPGLTSWLIGAPHPTKGTVRLLECERNHQEPITPHSHRFDFHCVVLTGIVTNIVWTLEEKETTENDLYERALLLYKGAPGQYEMSKRGQAYYSSHATTYWPGMTYSMEANDIHSIFFTKGTSVLFFEGPQTMDSSVILRPVVDGETIPTFKVEDWMFRRG